MPKKEHPAARGVSPKSQTAPPPCPSQFRACTKQREASLQSARRRARWSMFRAYQQCPHSGTVEGSLPGTIFLGSILLPGPSGWWWLGTRPCTKIVICVWNRVLLQVGQTHIPIPKGRALSLEIVFRTGSSSAMPPVFNQPPLDRGLQAAQSQRGTVVSTIGSLPIHRLKNIHQPAARKRKSRAGHRTRPVGLPHLCVSFLV